MAGDGVFLWYWGFGTEPECFYGACATGDDAMALARAECPDGGYSIVEADKTVPSNLCFNGRNVLEAFEEYNVECWGDDGLTGTYTPEQLTELEHKLADCLGRWLRKHSVGKAYNFNEIRHHDYFRAADDEVVN